MAERTKDFGVARERSYGGYSSRPDVELTYTEAEARVILEVEGDNHALMRREVVKGCAACFDKTCATHPDQDEGDDSEKWIVVEIRMAGRRYVEAAS